MIIIIIVIIIIIIIIIIIVIIIIVNFSWYVLFLQQSECTERQPGCGAQTLSRAGSVHLRSQDSQSEKGPGIGTGPEKGRGARGGRAAIL